RSYFPGPLVKISAANRQTVPFQDRRGSHSRLAALAQAVESDMTWVHFPPRLPPAPDLVVFGGEKRKQGLFCGILFSIQPAVTIFPAVKVVGGKSYEPALGEDGREVIVGGWLAIERIPRHTVPAVLTHHHWPAFAWFDVSGKDEDAPSEYFRPYVQ